MIEMHKYTINQRKRIAEMQNMSPEQWDTLCKHCGVCCLCKLDAGNNRTIYTTMACQHLDCDTHKCRVYDNRLAVRPRCSKVDINTVLANELLPASCGYVEYIFGPARHPATPNWHKIYPILDTDFDKLTPISILRRVIPESLQWQR